MNAIFDNYRFLDTLTHEDEADFRVYLQDPDNLEDGLMAVAGLTLNLLENDWNESKLMTILTSCDGIAPEMFERILVGVILIMMKYDREIRHNQALLEDLQEVLTFAPELSYTALCNIARTTQVKRIEQFNMQLTQELMPLMQDRHSNEFYDIVRSRQSEMERIAQMHLDQNFLIFREFYSTPFFRNDAANWLLPWNDKALLNLNEEDREDVSGLMQLWPLCDSDKYALCQMYHSFKGVIQSQLSVDSLRELGIGMNSNPIVTNGYVQQLYRFFRLAPHTKAQPFELASQMRNLMVYRLIVVGERAKQTISELLA
ncbi:MAG: hypothetical protein II248_00600 [Paludibacteraceae bacterium]|jgi:hypothetical protein|nr:hypothetical protein [Paludibacteraceae bacterium]